MSWWPSWHGFWGKVSDCSPADLRATMVITAPQGIYDSNTFTVTPNVPRGMFSWAIHIISCIIQMMPFRATLHQAMFPLELEIILTDKMDTIKQCAILLTRADGLSDPQSLLTWLGWKVSTHEMISAAEISLGFAIFWSYGLYVSQLMLSGEPHDFDVFVGGVDFDSVRGLSEKKYLRDHWLYEEWQKQING